MTVSLVAWLALFLSAASLGWQIVSWSRSGPRIKIQLEEVRARDKFEGAYVIVVSNEGRQTVTIPEVRLRWQKKRSEHFYNYLDLNWGVAISSAESDDLPATLNPGGSINIYASRAEVREQMQRNDIKFRDLIPQARLGVRWIDGELNGARRANRAENAPS